MFLLRAMFWITLVSLLLPREPDLGLGRPGGAAAWSGVLDSLTDFASRPNQTCTQYAAACQTGIALIDQFQGVTLDALTRVKAELKEARREGAHA